ncbi:MAG: hypothetical protein ACE10B_07490 [Phycisphaerales bacterium]|nr:hypothetical protein [Planctomycetota bacterium]MCZ6543070.1 hypothetical protein [Planctomycetota bacterium]MCZ6612518.1 hypothetical protein [Planctomycetota bacterium]MCZ6811266.1 hypothetical protein [Planctomycetota bacterium]MCZ6851182.1 hypothetical protein [Planctomycetota bacterium]
MPDLIAPLKTVTFTVTNVPKRPAERKTILRLMRMQPQIRRGLKNLARRRRQHDNVPIRHGGKIWIIRAKATRLANVEPGATFTLTLTPQIIPDLKSVERYLKAQPAR